MIKMSRREFIISSLGIIAAASLPIVFDFQNKCGENCYALKSGSGTYLIDKKTAEIIQSILDKKNIKADIVFEELNKKYNDNDIDKTVNLLVTIS